MAETEPVFERYRLEKVHRARDRRYIKDRKRLRYIYHPSGSMSWPLAEAREKVKELNA